MKLLHCICFLSSTISLFANEESAMDIAKRVIADKSRAFIPIEVTTSPISAHVHHPDDDQLADAAKKAHDEILSYMLSDFAPEKVRIAYAINILAGKRIPTANGNPHSFKLGKFDRSKNDGYLRDGLILTARLKEIQSAEANDANQPANPPESK